ncbi:cyclin-I-like isoform 5-T6 [Salvelinus alpinus]
MVGGQRGNGWWAERKWLVGREEMVGGQRGNGWWAERKWLVGRVGGLFAVVLNPTNPKVCLCACVCVCLCVSVCVCVCVQRVPLLCDLASSSRCGCSPSEILRMERIILDKLNWDLHAATPLEFLHIFHAMVLSCKPRFMVGLVGCNPSQHLSVLTQQLHYCLADSALLQPLSRGVMLALAIITLELENICPDWLALTINLLRKAQIDSSQLIRCRELVSRHLSTQEASLPPNTVYIYQSLHHSLDPDPCTRGRESNTTLPSPDTDPPAPFTAPRDRSLSWVSSTTLLQVHGPAKPNHHSHQVSLRCKQSAKRKVRAWLLHQPEWRRWRSTNSTRGSNDSTTKRTGALRKGRR